MNNSLSQIQTERLYGENVQHAHHPLLAGLLQNPLVAATLGGVSSDDQITSQIEVHTKHWANHGFGYWLFKKRNDNQLVGRGGLKYVQIDGAEDVQVEVGWAVAPELWSQGFGTEIGQAAVDIAFNQLGVKEVIAFTLPENVASRRVMEKLNFTYERNFSYSGYEHVLYRLRAE